MITCCRCGATPTYVGMTNGTTELGFLACTPDCGEWIWFVSPLPPPLPDGEGVGGERGGADARAVRPRHTGGRVAWARARGTEEKRGESL